MRGVPQWAHWGGGAKNGQCTELPQSKIGFEEPIFASPLLKAGAKIAPQGGARRPLAAAIATKLNNN